MSRTTAARSLLVRGAASRFAESTQRRVAARASANPALSCIERKAKITLASYRKRCRMNRIVRPRCRTGYWRYSMSNLLAQGAEPPSADSTPVRHCKNGHIKTESSIGYRSRCKECRKAEGRRRWERNTAHVRDLARIRYRRRRKVILEQAKQRYASLTNEQRSELARKQMATAVTRLYHISLETFQLMLAKQDNRCACCGVPFGQPKELRPCVDHDHRCCNRPGSCGKCVRALLCRKCNRCIGILERNPHLIVYAEKMERKQLCLNL